MMFYLRDNCFIKLVRFPLIFAHLRLIYLVFLKQMDKNALLLPLVTCILLSIPRLGSNLVLVIFLPDWMHPAENRMDAEVLLLILFFSFCSSLVDCFLRYSEDE